MAEAPENGKASHSVHANGMNEWCKKGPLLVGTVLYTVFTWIQDEGFLLHLMLKSVRLS
jgi:hypothetical protein